MHANDNTPTPALADLEELTRYGWGEAYIGEESQLVEDPHGTYVRFEDVHALARRAAQPAAPSPQVAEGAELPPLPEPDHSLDCGTQPFYRPDQLQKYARDAIAASRRAGTLINEGTTPAPASAGQAGQGVCVGCEGSPSMGNSPCGVCGTERAAAPADHKLTVDIVTAVLDEFGFLEGENEHSMQELCEALHSALATHQPQPEAKGSK